jgi:hypothetical protein
MLLEEDECTTHHAEEEEEEDDDSSSSSSAAAAVTAATYARLDISPVHVRRRSNTANNNMMIYSEPKARLCRHPYYSFDYDDDDDDDDDDSGIFDDDNDENGQAEEEDWTRTRHPSLFQQRPLLRRRRPILGGSSSSPQPPPFPSLLDSLSSSSSATETVTNTTPPLLDTTRIHHSEQLQHQQHHSSSSQGGRGERRRLCWAFPRRRLVLATTSPAAPIVAPRQQRTRWLISATHPLKLCWDVLTVILSLANAYATHAAICNREFVRGQPFLRFCEVWFVVDIILNFGTTRQVQAGVVLYTWQAVWARYLTSWFVIDVLSLFPGEILYIQPIIEAQKRRGWWQKLQLRSKAVARVTSRLLRHKFVRTWARPVLYHSKRVVGISVVTTIRKCIYFIPKYLQFVRNMKGVIALRLLRQVHWIRNVYLSWWNATRTAAAAARQRRRRRLRQNTMTMTTPVTKSSSRLSLPRRLRLRQFRSNIGGDDDDDDDTENLTEDGGDIISNNNTGNPDWEFLRDDDPF